MKLLLVLSFLVNSSFVYSCGYHLLKQKKLATHFSYYIKKDSLVLLKHDAGKKRKAITFIFSDKDLPLLKSQLGIWGDNFDFIEKSLGKITKPLKVQVGESLRDSTLRSTGYDFTSKYINFIKNNKTIDYGLQADDVILHEMVHATICQKFPKLCTEAFLTGPP